MPALNGSPDQVREASAAELLTQLESSPHGLSAAEAQTRLEKYGYNEIAEKKTNPILKFLSYFWGPIPWMIEAAAILSAIIHHWEDFGIIFALLLLNAMVGFWQEFKADNAIELLKQKLALQAKVLRDGAWQVIPARELVPGDIVRVRLGDIVPADVKLLAGRLSAGGRVRPHRRVPPGGKARQRRGLFRGQCAPGRDGRPGHRHRHAHLFRQDRPTGGRGQDRQPLPEGRHQDRQLPHRPGGGAGGRHHAHRPVPP